MILKKFRFGLRSVALFVVVCALFYWWMTEPDRVISRFVSALKNGDLDAANAMLTEKNQFETDSDTVYLCTGIGTDYECKDALIQFDSADESVAELSRDIASAVLVKDPCTFNDWITRQRTFHFPSRFFPLVYGGGEPQFRLDDYGYPVPVGVNSWGFRVVGDRIDMVGR